MSSHLLYLPTDERRVLDAVWLAAPGGLPQDLQSGYVARFGIAGSSGDPAWFATFDSHRASIPASGWVRVTPQGRMARAVPVAGSVVAEVAPYGSPVLAGALSVQMLVGPSSIVPAHRAGSASQRDADDALTAHAMTVGSGDQVVTRDLIPLGPVHFADDAHSSTNQEVSSTSYANGLVSVTFKRPRGRTRGWATVTAFASFAPASAAVGRLFLAVGDGTTDHGEQMGHTIASTTTYVPIGALFDGEIKNTTTFTLRVKIDGTGANIDIDRQSIGGSVVWE